MKADPIVTDLPEDYTRAIGRVAIKWAYLEHVFRITTYRLLDLDPKRGRVAVRDPRLKDYVNMIRDLAELAEINLPNNIFDGLIEALEETQVQRDMVVHGIWVRDRQSQALKVVRYSGTWKPDPKKPKTSRRMKPEGVPTNPEDLDKVTESIDLLISVAIELGKAVHAEMDRTSPDTPPPQSRAPDPPEDQK
jgi:hypothetical protein